MIYTINQQLTDAFREVITNIPWALLFAVAFPIALAETIRKYRG